LIYGIVVAAIIAWLERRTLPNAPERRVGILWLAVFSTALLLGALGMITILTALPFPSPLAVMRALTDLHLPYRTYRGIASGLLIAFGLAYFGISTLIFWTRPHSRMAKFAALALLVFGAAFFNTGKGWEGPVKTLPALGGLQALGLAALLLLFYLFPDGRFVPRWTRPLAVLWCAWLLVWFLNPLPGSSLDPGTWPQLILLGVLIGFLSTGVVAQLVRYRRASGLEEHRQMRWAVAGFTGAVAGLALVGLALMLFPDLQVTSLPGLSSLFVVSAYLFPWVLIPLSIALSVRRYRLWGA
jgi:hypothetical protein